MLLASNISSTANLTSIQPRTVIYTPVITYIVLYTSQPAFRGFTVTEFDQKASVMLFINVLWNGEKVHGSGSTELGMHVFFIVQLE